MRPPAARDARYQTGVEKNMNIYNVTYLRDESKWWVASVREVPGCHSQGQTIDEARRRVREALELFVDDAKSATLVDQGQDADL